MNSPSSHPDRIAALLAATPPREVSPELRRAAMRQTAPLLFILIGTIFTAFSMLFVAAFFPWNLTRQWRLDSGELATTSGTILLVERTGLSIGKRTVMSNTFMYSVAAGSPTLSGTCYTTGSRWSANTIVTVRYRPDDPSIACPEDARLTKTGGGAAFVLLLPGIGLTFLVIGLTLRHRALRLLVHGHVAKAHITAIEQTETRIGNDYVFRIVLKRTDRLDDPPIHVRRSDRAVVAFARERLESKRPVFVLFDPKRPQRALLPEVL